MITSFDDLLRFLRRRHACWGEPLPAAHIPDDLPPPLARLYGELGSLIDMAPLADGRHPFATQDALVPSAQLRQVDGTYEFAVENQGNWSCRAPVGPADPPVSSDAADAWETGPPRGFQIVCPSLEDFLITLCLQEALYSCPHLGLCDGRDIAAVATPPYQPLWLRGIYVHGEPTHEFYTHAGSDVLMMASPTGVWIGSHARGISERVRSEAPVTFVRGAG